MKLATVRSARGRFFTLQPLLTGRGHRLVAFFIEKWRV